MVVEDFMRRVRVTRVVEGERSMIKVWKLEVWIEGMDECDVYVLEIYLVGYLFVSVSVEVL